MKEEQKNMFFDRRTEGHRLLHDRRTRLFDRRTDVLAIWGGKKEKKRHYDRRNDVLKIRIGVIIFPTRWQKRRGQPRRNRRDH